MQLYINKCITLGARRLYMTLGGGVGGGVVGGGSGGKERVVFAT